MRTHARPLVVGLLWLAAGAPSFGEGLPPSKLPPRMDYLDNGVIRLGVDLSRGGTITHLSDSRGGPNVVNAYDLGREVQQAYYAGPRNPDIPNQEIYTAWNPTAAGDQDGRPAPVLDHRNDGREIYVKCAPRNWVRKEVPDECVAEAWMRLEANTVRVHNRLTNGRSDRNQYPAAEQELPAIFVNAPYDRTVTYDGPSPYELGPTRHVTETLALYGGTWYASERWSAMVDRNDWGLGVFNPDVLHYGGRFSGTRGAAGTTYDVTTNSFSPRRNEILDHDIVYEYDYVLILGTVQEIRDYAYRHRPADSRPDYVFDRDRQHWWYINASDAGYPIRGGLRVRLGDRPDPQLIGPGGWWRAEEVPKLYIRAAYRMAPGPDEHGAEVYWRGHGQPGFTAEQRVAFPIIPDGRVYTYEVDLASNPTYRGVITALRFDPVAIGGPRDTAQILSISHRRPDDER